MVGDLPFANVRPPENVLFVCKLNPVTRDEDLELIFSRFGVIMSCQVIRDKKTGDSLQYAFIEFDTREGAEQVRVYPAGSPPTLMAGQAYFKMQNVLVDDRRIWVDLCVPSQHFVSIQTADHLTAPNPSRNSIPHGPTILRWVRKADGEERAHDLGSPVGTIWSRRDAIGTRMMIGGGEGMVWFSTSLEVRRSQGDVNAAGVGAKRETAARIKAADGQGHRQRGRIDGGAEAETERGAQ